MTDTITKRPGADLDAWIRQQQTIEDVAQFIRRHGPNSASPLPVLHWTLGAFRTAGADLLAAYDDDPVTTLKMFATVLGSSVTVRHLEDRLIYLVQGRIGRKDGAAQVRRTQIAVRAVVFRPLDDEDGDA